MIFSICLLGIVPQSTTFPSSFAICHFCTLTVFVYKDYIAILITVCLVRVVIIVDQIQLFDTEVFAVFLLIFVCHGFSIIPSTSSEL